LFYYVVVVDVGVDISISVFGRDIVCCRIR